MCFCKVNNCSKVTVGHINAWFLTFLVLTWCKLQLLFKIHASFYWFCLCVKENWMWDGSLCRISCSVSAVLVLRMGLKIEPQGMSFFCRMTGLCLKLCSHSGPNLIFPHMWPRSYCWVIVWTAQITWNLINLNQIWTTYICGSKSDTDPIFWNDLSLNRRETCIRIQCEFYVTLH